MARTVHLGDVLGRDFGGRTARRGPVLESCGVSGCRVVDDRGSRKVTDSGRIRQEDAERTRSGAWSLENDRCLNAYGILMERKNVLEQSVNSIDNIGVENMLSTF